MYIRSYNPANNVLLGQVESTEIDEIKSKKEDYNRIKKLNICEMSEIMYVNITEPYYFFNIYDPEGNTIEICGKL